MTLAAKAWAAVPAFGTPAASIRDIAQWAGLGDERQSYIRDLARLWAQHGFVQVVRVGPRKISLVKTVSAPVLCPMVHTDQITGDRGAVAVDPVMSGAEFAALRRASGVSQTRMAEALGWSGTPSTLSRFIKRLENGRHPITAPMLERIRAVTSKGHQ